MSKPDDRVPANDDPHDLENSEPDYEEVLEQLPEAHPTDGPAPAP
ncbi:hypothetical protein ACFSBZ_00365 [Amnibacterium flavum]|nr:hypothetical protein [Amnibacterium flavum]